jgi:hypothetical protein
MPSSFLRSRVVRGLGQPWAVGRTTISPTSTLPGCSMANATARAIASGGIAIASRWAIRAAAVSALPPLPMPSVFVKPGETKVTAAAQSCWPCPRRKVTGVKQRDAPDGVSVS